MNDKIWHNGKFKNHNEPVFTALDRIRLGDGVFDTMLVIIAQPNAQAQLIHAEPHFARLLHDVNTLGITGALPNTTELQETANALIAENNLTPGHYALNTVISHGPAARGLSAPETPEPQIIMRLSPTPQEYPPIHAIIAQTVHRNEGSPLSRIKSCNYGDNILALKEATEKGANDAILLNNQGHVTCATTGNIFAIINGTLTTPPLEDGVMNGVTRARIIQQLDIREQSFSGEDLKNCEGFYITNSLRGASPVVSLNKQALPMPSLPINNNFHVE